MLDLSIIVTTFETKDLLRQALQTAKADLEGSAMKHEIIVVDNGSRDGTSDMVKEQFREVRLISNAENVGLARALNQAIEFASESRYVLQMDSDVEVHPGGITRIVEYLDAHPDVSGGSPAEYDARTKRKKKGRFTIGPSLRRPNWNEPFRTEFTGNTFVIVRAEVFQSVGLYDEQYVFSVEDLDWNHRALLKGHVFMYIPDAEITHHGRKGKHQNRELVTAELYRTNYYYFRKFYSRPVAWLAYWALRIDLAVSRFRGRNNAAAKAAFEKALEKLKNERRPYRQLSIGQ